MSPTSIARGEPLVFQLISCTFYVEEPLPPCSSDKDVGGDELKRGLHLFQENSERLEFSFTVFYAMLSLMLTWLGPLMGFIHWSLTANQATALLLSFRFLWKPSINAEPNINCTVGGGISATFIYLYYGKAPSPVQRWWRCWGWWVKEEVAFVLAQFGKTWIQF